MCIKIPIRHVAIALFFGEQNAIFALNIYANFILIAELGISQKSKIDDSSAYTW